MNTYHASGSFDFNISAPTREAVRNRLLKLLKDSGFPETCFQIEISHYDPPPKSVAPPTYLPTKKPRRPKQTAKRPKVKSKAIMP